MAWLNYQDDEVAFFHPVFEDCANRALLADGLATTYEWVHHIYQPGVSIVPDFVLRERATNRWRICFELKRTPGSVHSTRNQVQAKGYAEHNSAIYPLGVPRYFAIGNLETSVLFALNSGLPASECRVASGVFSAGSFATADEATFRSSLTEQLRALTSRVLSAGAPTFDQLWPRVSVGLVGAAAALPNIVPSHHPGTQNWDKLQAFFCQPAVDSKRLLLLRCLLAEYLRGVLTRFGHAGSGRLIPLRHDPPGGLRIELANVFGRLLEVDFRQVFSEELMHWVRSTMSGPDTSVIAAYVKSITEPPSEIERQARQRLDSAELVERVSTATHQDTMPGDRGKVSTDPELARLLANLVISEDTSIVCDPCCGDGALLDAAYDVLCGKGRSHSEALGLLSGVEVDPVLATLTIVRLLLKEPVSISPNDSIDVAHADTFSEGPRLAAATVVLMNPPFRRYETPGEGNSPDDIKTHYSNQIRGLTNAEAISASGQQNLFTYYVEFVVSAAAPGTRFAIILDNRWYHNSYGEPLRRFLHSQCTIEALLEYPFSGLFSDWTIATSIVVLRKTPASPTAVVRFIRTNRDLARIDPISTGLAFNGSGEWPSGWSIKAVRQCDLDPTTGWKVHFVDVLNRDFRRDLPRLRDLFTHCRRGSLAKEEGGMSALAFPFSRLRFGFKRTALPGARRPGQNRRGPALSSDENRRLSRLAAAIPGSFRGYAVENADTLTKLILDSNELLAQATIEPPAVRSQVNSWTSRRSAWGADHDNALREIQNEVSVAAFVDAFREATGLTEAAMENRLLWIGLREPVAGELIIPRKTRRGLKVHLNPYAWNRQGRQVRISSNFVTFIDCCATDNNTDRETASQLIAAFLLSSFGQLQFEMSGYNREGCLSLEANQLREFSVFDPRLVAPDERAAILATLHGLPFPLEMNQLASGKPEQRLLDGHIARTLCRLYRWDEPDRLVNDVEALLDEYVLARG